MDPSFEGLIELWRQCIVAIIITSIVIFAAASIIVALPTPINVLAAFLSMHYIDVWPAFLASLFWLGLISSLLNTVLILTIFFVGLYSLMAIYLAIDQTTIGNPTRTNKTFADLELSEDEITAIKTKLKHLYPIIAAFRDDKLTDNAKKLRQKYNDLIKDRLDPSIECPIALVSYKEATDKNYAVLFKQYKTNGQWKAVKNQTDVFDKKMLSTWLKSGKNHPKYNDNVYNPSKHLDCETRYRFHAYDFVDGDKRIAISAELCEIAQELERLASLPSSTATATGDLFSLTDHKAYPGLDSALTHSSALLPRTQSFG